MFGRAIWDKLPECIYENFEIAWVKRGQFQNFQKSREWFILKIARWNMWLLVNNTKPTSTLYWNYYLLTASNFKLESGQLQKSWQLQNNTVNGAMLITINRVITLVIINYNWQLNSRIFFLLEQSTTLNVYHWKHCTLVNQSEWS